ncbi:protein tyrosine phosphatase family protein [Marinobacter halodurans]|uniref:protein tyrosine phosphatase family protein n=1 Tax=Marinobacter halodurans TaxID=2528979 RepID=UPI0013F1447A|nr:protein tyrosine phosphatase family protein [Marinobacter halodurans]
MDRIFNFVSLTGQIGTAGQPTSEQFALVASHGYSTVINLAMPDHPRALADEGDRVTREGMTYLHLPVPFDAPQPHHVRRFCRLLQALREDDPQQKIFIHCIMNYRVSAFMTHYLRLVEGYDAADARSPLFDRWAPDATWQALLAWDRAHIGL